MECEPRVLVQVGNRRFVLRAEGDYVDIEYLHKDRMGKSKWDYEDGISISERDGGGIPLADVRTPLAALLRLIRDGQLCAKAKGGES